MKTILGVENTLKAFADELEEPDRAVCESCGWEGKPGDCETFQERESLESLPYQVAICPECSEGDVIFVGAY